jgi:hypothetical protein
MRLYIVLYKSKTSTGATNAQPASPALPLSYENGLTTILGGIRTRNLGIKSAKYGRATTPDRGWKKMHWGKKRRVCYLLRVYPFRHRGF